jgi:hypothetical protein
MAYGMGGLQFFLKVLNDHLMASALDCIPLGGNLVFRCCGKIGINESHITLLVLLGDRERLSGLGALMEQLAEKKRTVRKKEPFGLRNRT